MDSTSTKLQQTPTLKALEARALEVLESNWNDELRATLPHRITYPHRWLWDSCFHAMAWSRLGRREGAIELAAVLSSQLPTRDDRGFLPHMVYGDPERKGGDVDRGPLWGMSAFTQPPVYVMALSYLKQCGLETEPWMLDAAEAALEWLWSYRMHDGLLVLVHPWESGADISPRFDDWYGPLHYEALDQDYDRLVRTTLYSPGGTAIGNPECEVAAAAFNGIAQHAALLLAQLTGKQDWADRAGALARELDAQLWDPDEGLWRDRPDKPAGAGELSSRIPTLDGVVAALGSSSGEHVQTALEQCTGSGRFAAPFGPRYLPKEHPLYQPTRYWRGPSWPQLNYLLVAAANQHGLASIAEEISEHAIRGTWASGFSEYWNPETGEACGATPQSWAAIAVLLTPEGRK